MTYAVPMFPSENDDKLSGFGDDEGMRVPVKNKYSIGAATKLMRKNRQDNDLSTRKYRFTPTPRCDSASKLVPHIGERPSVKHQHTIRTC